MVAVDRGEVADDFWPTFRTVFVETALFSDDLELRRLVRDPLRSTASTELVVRLFTGPTDVPPCPLLSRKEFVRFGKTPVRNAMLGTVDGIRNDRLRSRLARLRSKRL